MLEAVLLGAVAALGVEPLAPMPVVLVLLPGDVVVVVALALGVTVVELSRPDVRVLVDVQPAAMAAAAAIARMEKVCFVMGIPCSRT